MRRITEMRKDETTPDNDVLKEQATADTETSIEKGGDLTKL